MQRAISEGAWRVKALDFVGESQSERGEGRITMKIHGSEFEAFLP